MEQRKLRSKVQIKKFLEDNKKVIKGLGRKTGGTEIYTREPWMTGMKNLSIKNHTVCSNTRTVKLKYFSPH